MPVSKVLLRTLPAVILSFSCIHAPPASAQTAPTTKQFRVILTYPPGGASDIMGRIIAQKLGDIWGQTVLVENRSGANPWTPVVTFRYLSRGKLSRGSSCSNRRRIFIQTRNLRSGGRRD